MQLEIECSWKIIQPEHQQLEPNRTQQRKSQPIGKKPRPMQERSQTVDKHKTGAGKLHVWCVDWDVDLPKQCKMYKQFPCFSFVFVVNFYLCRDLILYWFILLYRIGLSYFRVLGYGGSICRRTTVFSHTYMILRFTFSSLSSLNTIRALPPSPVLQIYCST